MTNPIPPKKPENGYTIPGSGVSVSRDDLRRASYSLPPTRMIGAQPVLTQVQNVRMFPVLDTHRKCIAELTFTHKDGAWHFGRSPFKERQFEQRLNHHDAGRLQLAAKYCEWPTLDAFHPAALPWYCRECGCNYAESSWLVRTVIDEDEPSRVDSYRGSCPHGHVRIIAD